MNWLQQVFKTTIGKKYLVALTGFGLVGFIVAHLGGNLTLFASPEAFNAYADALHHMEFLHLPLLPLAEVGLLALFLGHILLTVSLWRDNKAARGKDKYVMQKSKQDSVIPWFSARMLNTGLIVLAFLVIHVGSFRFPVFMEHFANETLYDRVVRSLANPWVAGFYILSALFLGGHLVHGIQSLFRSVGFHHEKITPAIEQASLVLGFALSFGFASLPLWLNYIN